MRRMLVAVILGVVGCASPAAGQTTDPLRGFAGIWVLDRGASGNAAGAGPERMVVRAEGTGFRVQSETGGSDGGIIEEYRLDGAPGTEEVRGGRLATETRGQLTLLGEGCIELKGQTWPAPDGRSARPVAGGEKPIVVTRRWTLRGASTLEVRQVGMGGIRTYTRVATDTSSPQGEVEQPVHGMGADSGAPSGEERGHGGSLR
jgi:hypothetical protein